MNSNLNVINPSANTLQSITNGVGRVSLAINDKIGITDFEIEQHRILRLAISETYLVMQFIDNNSGITKTKIIAQFD